MRLFASINFWFEKTWLGKIHLFPSPILGGKKASAGKNAGEGRVKIWRGENSGRVEFEMSLVSISIILGL